MLCSKGYRLSPDGSCYNWLWKVWSGVLVVVAIFVVILVLWYLELLLFRPLSNTEGLRSGLEFRSRSGLKVPKKPLDVGKALERRQLRVGDPWPLSVNVHRVTVGGTGLVLFFNFEVCVILWVATASGLWVIFCLYTDPQQLTLGLAVPKTPQDYCLETLRGHFEQVQLLSFKVFFLFLAYVLSSVGCLWYAVFQSRAFDALDDETTMKDYAATLTGLPKMSGDTVEEYIRDLVAGATGQSVVGVSVCWDIKSREDEIYEALERETLEAQLAHASSQSSSFATSRTVSSEMELPQSSGARGLLRRIDSALGYRGVGNNNNNNVESSEAIGDAPLDVVKPFVKGAGLKDFVRDVECTDTAFVVFVSEEARDQALTASASGIQFKGKMLRLRETNIEPSMVCWSHFAVTPRRFYAQCLLGCITMFLALALWGILFYLPWATYSASFSYAAGSEPGVAEQIVFTTLVIVGNQFIYFVSQKIAYSVGFRFSGAAEAFYVVLYTLACCTNMCADLCLEGVIGHKALVGSRVHVSDGRLLEELTSPQELLESYPMQAVLGSKFFDYSTATFLTPLIVEPLFNVWLPSHLHKLLVRTHPEVRGTLAEKSLDLPVEMDLSRYGDILLNVTISTAILFLPSGQFLRTMMCLLLSCLVLYAFDRYRVLRAVRSFEFASKAVETTTQVMLAFPCAIIVACFVFKLNRLYGDPLRGLVLLGCCGCAFVCHVLLHIVVLFWALRRFGHLGHEKATESYEQMAGRVACSWFTANPMNCLRSKYVHEHLPPCGFFVRGKERLLRANRRAGNFYEEVPDTRTSVSDPRGSKTG